MAEDTELCFSFVRRGRKLAPSRGMGHLASERAFVKVCRRAVFNYRLHLLLLLLTLNEIGNNKFVFPGVMVYISMLQFHLTLKSFQFFIFYFFHGEGKGGLGFCPSFYIILLLLIFGAHELDFIAFLLPSPQWQERR